MSQDQLKRAFQLIKQGDKDAAAPIVKDVLREDRNNADAWWLMAIIVDDTDKKIRGAKKVLSLRPDHTGATKMLQQLAPHELPAQDAEDFFAVSADGSKSLPDIGGNSQPKRKQKQQSGSNNLVLMGLVGAVAIAVIAGVLAIISLFTGDSGSSNGGFAANGGFERIVDVARDGDVEIAYDDGGFVSITAEGINGSDPVLEVLNSDGFQIASNDDHDGYPGLSTFDAALPFIPVGDEITVRVRTFAGNSGQVQVTITPIDLSEAVNATINIGERVTIDLDDNNGVGVVEIRGSGTVDVIAQATGNSDVDPVLEIIAANGSSLGRNDDHNTNIDGLDWLDSVVEDVSISGNSYAVVSDWAGFFSNGEVTVSAR